MPTVMVEEEDRREEGLKLPGDADMCDGAPVSKFQSEALGGCCGTPAD